MCPLQQNSSFKHTQSSSSLWSQKELGFSPSKPSFQNNLLHQAVENQDCDLLLELINNHVYDINQPGWLKETALHLAAANNSKKILTILLANGAEITTSACGQTPLHVAAEKGSLACIELLTEHDESQLTMLSNWGTPLDEARRYHHDEAVTYLEAQSAIRCDFK